MLRISIVRALTPNAALGHRDQLRVAREQATADAEGFMTVLFAIERFGTAIVGRAAALGEYRAELVAFAEKSPLASLIPNAHREHLTPFESLFYLVRVARNDAMHQGAFARHLTSHAVELSIVLEDALMPDGQIVADYMVKGVVCAELWQPLAFLRQAMLANSFSCLPVRLDDMSWALVSDAALASALRQSSPGRNAALGVTLEEAINCGLIATEQPVILAPTSRVSDVLRKISARPALVLHPEHPSEIIGIIAAFDLM